MLTVTYLLFVLRSVLLGRTFIQIFFDGAGKALVFSFKFLVLFTNRYKKTKAEELMRKLYEFAKQTTRGGGSLYSKGRSTPMTQINLRYDRFHLKDA